MRPFCIIALFFSIVSLEAQDFQKVYEYELKRSMESLLKGNQTEVEISPSGDYVMMAAENHVKAINKDGELIFSHGCVPKVNSEASLASDLIGGEMGRMISSVKLDEGNGFWLFEDDGLMLVLDWNLDENHLIGYDLNTGEELWKRDEYRYTPGKDGQLAAVLAATALSTVASETYSMAAIQSAAAFSSIHTDLTSREGIGSERARAFITPLPGTGDFLLTNEKGITSIDKRTGEENWTYDERPLKIGEAVVLPDGEDVFLVNYSPDFFLNSDGYLVRLDLETGEEKAMIDFKGSFSSGRIYFLEDRFILDYFGPEVYDLETNELVYEAIPREEYEEDKKVKAVKLEKDFINPSASWYDEDKIFYSRSDGSTTKKWVMAHDLETGEKLWQTEEMDKTMEIADQKDEVLLIKEFGIGKNFFTNLAKSDGKIASGPVKVKQPLMVEERKPWLFTTEEHLVHNGNKLYFLNKETLEEEKAVKLKKAKIGEVYAMDLLPTGFVMVGEKGIAFYDRRGNFQERIKINGVSRGLWTDDYLLAITEGNLIASGDIHMISIKNRKKVAEMEVSDLTVFSPNLDHVLRANNASATKLELYAIK